MLIIHSNKYKIKNAKTKKNPNQCEINNLIEKENSYLGKKDRRDDLNIRMIKILSLIF